MAWRPRVSGDGPPVGAFMDVDYEAAPRERGWAQRRELPAKHVGGGPA